MNIAELHHASPWPHRVAVLLVCTVFPLIWVGGLVTTYDAGMAVPDWPTTYGYNLFLYPWQTWFYGPWDLFIEHGHRLLGALAGMLTIVLVFTIWRQDHRVWLRWLVMAAFALVLAQGVLGGLRVIENSRHFAMIHACVGPVFFSLCVVLATVTSVWWKKTDKTLSHEAAGKLHRLAIGTIGFTYIQLILGALLRHLPVDASWGSFRAVLMAHLFVAVVLVAHIGNLVARIFIYHRCRKRLWCPAAALGIFTLSQLILGASTWVVNYSWPAWMIQSQWTEGFTIRAEGMLQSMTVTAHVANGSLILALTVLLALRSLRSVGPSPKRFGSRRFVTEAVA